MISKKKNYILIILVDFYASLSRFFLLHRSGSTFTEVCRYIIIACPSYCKIINETKKRHKAKIANLHLNLAGKGCIQINTFFTRLAVGFVAMIEKYIYVHNYAFPPLFYPLAIIFFPPTCY